MSAQSSSVGGRRLAGVRPASVDRIPDRSPRRRRRWMIGLAIIAAVAGCVCFAPSLASYPRVQRLLLQVVAPSHARRLQIDSLSIGWLRPIEARGVRYRTSEFELVAESARCDRTVLDLLRDRHALGRVELKSPQLTLAADHTPGESTSSTRPMKSSDAKKNTPQTEFSGELHVTDGVIALADSESPIVRGLNLFVRVPAGSDRAEFRLIARTGDPSATAHLSARGAMAVPLSLPRPQLIEAQLEAVGVELALVQHLLIPVSDSRAIRYELSGLATGSAELRRADDGSVQARSHFEIQSLMMTDSDSDWRLEEPAVSVSAVASLFADRLTLSSLRVASESITIDASGTVTDWAGGAEAELGGTARCDWQVLPARLGEKWPQYLRLSGSERRPWQLVGPLRSGATLITGTSGQAATAMDSVRLYDYDLGAVELTAHWAERMLKFDPVQLAVQNGRIAVEPQVSFEHGLPILRVPPGRVLHELQLDPQLCDGVLRYVDPLFTVSGNWSGRLSFDVDELEIPLVANGLRHGRLTGTLLLDDVEFMPDDSLAEIFAIAGIHQTNIRTSQHILVRLEDGRLHHSGLALPVENGEKVTLDGWVDLDHRLNLRVSLPVTERMLGKDKRLYRLLKGQRIEVPVTGTVDEPEVTEEAIARNVQRLIQIALRDSLSGDDPLRGLLKRALK